MCVCVCVRACVCVQVYIRTIVTPCLLFCHTYTCVNFGYTILYHFVGVDRLCTHATYRASTCTVAVLYIEYVYVNWIKMLT